MARRFRLFMLMAVLALAPLAIACGAAEEPAPEPEPAPAEPAPAPEPAPADSEPADTPAPASNEPQLVGEIRVSGEDFEWGETNNETAAYTWTARVTNDTTATLDITVRFEFLDEQDRVIKTENASVRLDPAQSRTLRESGSMVYDEANRIYSFRAVTDYKIPEG